MAIIDVDALKAPLGDPAVGPDLRGEVEFGEIEESPRGFGAATPGDIAKTVKQCAALFARSKDQSPAIVALEAAARLGDLGEMRAAIALIEHLINDHWDDYHPGPADEMGEARINELAALKRRAALLLPLSKLAIAKVPGPGDLSFTIGMVRAASVPIAAWTKEDDAKLKEMLDKGNATKFDADNQKLQHERGRVLRGIARAVSPTARSADVDAEITFDDMASIPDVEAVASGLIVQVGEKVAPLSDLGDALLGIDEAFSTKMGSNPGLSAVAGELFAMSKACTEFVEAFTEPVFDMAETAAADEAAPVTAGVALAAVPKPVALGLDSVRTRVDVITALEAIIRYYGENEPGSPVPIMVKRVRGWVNKDFFDVMRDISPGQIDELMKLLVSRE